MGEVSDSSDFSAHCFGASDRQGPKGGDGAIRGTYHNRVTRHRPFVPKAERRNVTKAGGQTTRENY